MLTIIETERLRHCYRISEQITEVVSQSALGSNPSLVCSLWEFWHLRSLHGTMIYHMHCALFILVLRACVLKVTPFRGVSCSNGYTFDIEVVGLPSDVSINAP